MADADLAFPLDINNSDLNCVRREGPYRKAMKKKIASEFFKESSQDTFASTWFPLHKLRIMIENLFCFIVRMKLILYMYAIVIFKNSNFIP